MSAREKTPREIVAAHREDWEEWKRLNSSDAKMSASLPDILRTRMIASALEFAWDCKTVDDFERLEPLFSASSECRYDLIIDAAELLQNEHCWQRPEVRSKHLAPWIAYRLSQIRPELSKKEIIQYIEDVHPEIAEFMQTTPQGKTNFWKKVECSAGDIPQTRGGTSGGQSAQLKELIRNGKKCVKQGFPMFLGPRENPDWQ